MAKTRKGQNLKAKKPKTNSYYLVRISKRLLLIVSTLYSSQGCLHGSPMLITATENLKNGSRES